MRKLILIVALAAALMLSVVAVAPAAAGGKPGGVIGFSAQDPGGDSQCQNGQVINLDSWRWYGGRDGGGYARRWTDVYSCDGGRWVYVTGFWN